MHAKQRKQHEFTGQLMIADQDIDTPQDNKKEKRVQSITRARLRKKKETRAE